MPTLRINTRVDLQRLLLDLQREETRLIEEPAAIRAEKAECEARLRSLQNGKSTPGILS